VTAIVVCVLLFAVEALVDYFRITRTNSSFSPVIITIVFYILVSAILTVCYVICAVSIMKRISDMGSSKAARMKKMTLRFSLSTAGYIATIILEIVTYIVNGVPWGPQLSYNLLFAAMNWTAMLQIIALKPIGSGRKSSTTGTKTSESSQVLHTI
jgi:hypothetical protein